MSLEQWYAAQLIKGLTKEEKQSMVKMITNEFIVSMSPSDRKEMVKIVLPDIVHQLMDGMTPGERKELVETVMPLMIEQIGAQKATNHEKKDNRPHTDNGRED